MGENLSKGFMVEMRQRIQIQRGYHAYSQLATRDDEDDTPKPISINSYNRTNRKDIIRTQKSSVCARFCFFFSLSGVVFLSSLAIYLGSENYVYLQIGEIDKKQRQESLDGVIGAILMYLISMAISGRMWYLANNHTEVVDSRFMD